jgi:hypothetical protein
MGGVRINPAVSLITKGFIACTPLYYSITIRRITTLCRSEQHGSFGVNLVLIYIIVYEDPYTFRI